jgi:hypothetical protein
VLKIAKPRIAMIGAGSVVFVKNLLTFIAFFYLMFLGSLAHTVLAVKLGFQAKPTPRDVSRLEVVLNFLAVCLGVTLAYLLIVVDSAELASAYFYGFLIGLPPCLFLIPRSWGFNFALEQVRDRLILVGFLAAGIIALGLATNLELWLKKI